MENIASVTSKISQTVSQVNGVDLTNKVKSNLLCEADCSICGGMGWIRQDLPPSDPKFGKLQPCPNSDPFKRYGGLMGLDTSEHGLSWQAILDYSDAKKAANTVQDTLKSGSGWVFLWGDYGLAKTLILKVALAEFCRKTRKPASYIRMAELIDHLRGAFDANNPSEESQARLNMWADLPLLCIDEFDRVRNTEYASERRFVLMDRRYEQATRGKSITLMASNSSPDMLDGYLADRIRDGRFQVVKLTGRSARPLMG